MSAVHINTGGGTYVRRDDLYGCPVCDIEDAPIVRYYSASPYYGSRGTCTCCGDSWEDGFLHERPFLRGWRQQAIDKAMRDWENACECPVDRDDDLYILPCKCAEESA